MNGLRFIRTRCNLSLSELANKLGITRQALSSWENGYKEIPSQRKEQLVDFFGIDASYFGEISEKEKQILFDKAMFRYDENGKQTYRYKPREGVIDLKNERIYFLGTTEISLDEEYIQARQKKEQTLKRIDTLIKWENPGSMLSEISCINRGCGIYDKLSELLEEMRRNESLLKMPFFHEVEGILEAMLVAYGRMEAEQVQSCYDVKEYPYEKDVEWVLYLAEKIKEHWDAKKFAIEKYYEESWRSWKEDRKREKKELENTKKEIKSIEQQIEEAEARHKEFKKAHPEHFLASCE